MYEIGFEHENNMNYMVIFSDKAERKEGYQMKMLLKNKIKGMLSVKVRYIDNKKVYYYEITSKQQMTKLYEYSKLTWKDVSNICISISELVKVINEFMLDLDFVVLRPECMYVDVATGRYSFAYCPEENQNFTLMMRSLFEYIIEHYDHNTDKEELMQVYAIYQKITHNEYDPEHLIQLISIEEKREQEKDADCEAYDTDYAKEAGKSCVIEDIPCEEINSEREVKDIWKKRRIYIGMGVSALMVTMGMLSLFLPEKAVFKLNMAWSVATILAGGVLYTKLKPMFKSAKYSMTIKSETYQQPYVKNDDQSIKKTVDSECHSKADVENKSGTGTEDVAARESKVTAQSVGAASAADETGQVVQKMYNTVCLSDYTQILQMKKEVITLRYQESVAEGNSEYNRRRDIMDNPEKGNMDQFIDIFPCVIGNFLEYCDVLIQNPLVSRMHMSIKKEGGKYFVEDMNSTNGTFVNGIRVKPDEAAEIVYGDILKIATLTYKVEIS